MCTLDNSPLSCVYFAKCLPLSGLIWKFSWHCLSQNIIFNFDEIQFVVVTKMSSPSQRSSRFSPIIVSRSFIVSCFTFRSMIYFELIFVKSVKTVTFFFLHVVVQLSQHSVEKTIFQPLCCLCPFVKDQLTILVCVYF